MFSALRTPLLALAVALAPVSLHAQDDQGSDLLTSTTSSTSPGESNGDPASDGASTAEFIVSPFVATETGVVTASEWTTQQLALTLSQVAVVMVIILMIAIVLALIGVAIYLTFRTPAANETAFRRFLRNNRPALVQQVVAGHGPVLRDFAALFEIYENYPTIARLIRDDDEEFLALLDAVAIEGDGPVQIASKMVSMGLGSSAIVSEWLDRGALGLRFSF